MPAARQTRQDDRAVPVANFTVPPETSAGVTSPVSDFPVPPKLQPIPSDLPSYVGKLYRAGPLKIDYRIGWAGVKHGFSVLLIFVGSQRHFAYVSVL